MNNKLDTFLAVSGENYNVYRGSNLDVLPFMADNSVDSIVTDPPYELGFMGKSWDSSGIAYSVDLWRECLRVLKPGGHLLAFSGSRTYHRMTVAIEDAGFEIRDMISWISNKTFPKSLNIGKAIDKALGADEAKQWDGWGTALKPTVEPIVMARKPLIGTVAENVLQYGTGGINIDASRIGNEERHNPSASNKDRDAWRMNTNETDGRAVIGRWPANVMFDEDTAAELDRQEPDASRFFYVARAATKDRNEGLDAIEGKEIGGKGNGLARACAICKTSILDGCECPDRTFINPIRQNFHPTVKPTPLMEYLITLVTPPGGTVLDPFTGSGSTGKAAILNGYRFTGIELTAEYLPIIDGRLTWATNIVNEQLAAAERLANERLF